jgi:hypothetical protein
MIEIKLIDFFKNIDCNIEINDFNTIERNFKYSLRFELGLGFKNGTKKRVDLATNRASQLFIDCFDNDQELFVLTYEWEDELFRRTPDYLFQVINKTGFVSNRELAIRYFDNEEPEYLSGKIGIFEVSLNKIDYANIFRGIANAEMGFDPCIHQIVYFIGQSSKKTFWMYDDRGCLIMSPDINLLNSEFEKHCDWLCDGYKELFEKELKTVANEPAAKQCGRLPIADNDQTCKQKRKTKLNNK